MRFTAFLTVLLIVSALGAQDKTPEAVKLVVYPSAAPSPALKHFLLPPARELKPGNAAVFYQRAHSPDLFNAFERLGWFSKLHDWLDQPIAKTLEKDDTLSPHGPGRQALLRSEIFKELAYAARCESCDWQLSDRLRAEGIGLLLPEVNSLRQMAQLVAFKARVEIQDNQIDQAFATLQTGFAMGRHVADCPILIHALVGMSIGQTMLGSVEEFIQRPGAPNLYWALRDLPEPYVDLRRPLQGDRMLIDGWMPDIRRMLSEPKFQPLPLHTLRSQVDKVIGFPHGSNRTDFAAALALVHPQAVTFFRARGHSAEELDALPVTQLVLMYSLAQWDHWYDATYRWHNVPYWQARAGLKQAVEQRERILRGQREGLTILVQLVSPNESIFFLKARLQRRIAALQCVEALRMYAAAHNGKLPDALEDIREVPIPLDPVTGKPFEYASDGITARLHGPRPPGELASERTVLLYQISLKKK
jgi:hypothetical protein